MKITVRYIMWNKFFNWLKPEKKVDRYNPDADWENMYPLTDEDLRRFNLGWYVKEGVDYDELVWRRSRMQEIKAAKWREFYIRRRKII